MMRVDDDAVCERTLVAAYGACILAKDHSALKSTCEVIAEALAHSPEKFHNALLRDHTRCFAELAQMLGVDGSPQNLLSLLDGLRSPWPLRLPSNEQVKAWDSLPKLAHSCLHDDFFVYSLNCLDDWGDSVPKTDMGKWILRRIAEDFGYAGSGCERYDGYMLSLHGGVDPSQRGPKESARNISGLRCTNWLQDYLTILSAIEKEDSGPSRCGLL